MATSTVTLGTSNLRGSSRQTRINPTRVSRTNRPNLRQNSMISTLPPNVQASPESRGFCPAINHFSDAIAAVPREYRRHTSLLKEVDAKAWFPEENLQHLLEQCLVERQTRPVVSTANTIAGSVGHVADDTVPFSTTNSINGATLDNASQYSSQSAEPLLMQRRQMYAALRHNLMQMMITMDEKNHVINNASEDLTRHIRRLDSVWPHVEGELSEEARLGSLKHWAYTDMNPVVKKTPAVSARREAAASLAIMADNDIAHRSESRREAMLAKKLKPQLQQADSDFDDKGGRKGTATGKLKKTAAEIIAELPSVSSSGKKKTARVAGGVAMERSASGAKAGGVSMSREPSQQDAVKKRKAPVSASTVARKRLNANAQESPRLASSPLANIQGKDAVKRSPALSSVRPIASRGRQNSAQGEPSRRRPSSSAARNAGIGLGLSASDMNSVAAATGRSTAEVKNTMKESVNSKGDKLVEQARPLNGETVRGGLLMERTSSRQGTLKREANHEDKSAASPRLGTALTLQDTRTGRGRASKTSTPIVSTFEEAEADAEAEASTTGNGSESGTGTGASSKLKRAPRPRMKDHHGLHDSLSPKGLPMKRTHNKTSSFSSLPAQSIPGVKTSSRSGRERDRDRDRDRMTDHEGAPMSRSVSRSNNNINTTNFNTSQTQNSTSASTPTNSFPSASTLKANPHSPISEEEIDSNDADDLNENDDADGEIEGDAELEGEAEAETEVDPEPEADNEEDEQRYCYCNGVSYGEMVACDNKKCPREWFHLDCIGLRSLPRSAKWYCDECKENLAKRGRFVGAGGNAHGHGHGHGSHHHGGGSTGNGAGNGNNHHQHHHHNNNNHNMTGSNANS